MSDTALIPPALRARLAGLRLAARRPAPGRGLGAHASYSRGAGLEFAQYRAYEAGDDLRRVDWKLAARSDRFYVREAERDSALQLMLLVDTTRSMSQADAQGPSRLAVAARLAACAAALALRQNDAFGLIAAGSAPIPPAAGPRQHERLLHALQRLRADADEYAEAALAPLAAAVPAGAIVLVLSDGFDEALLRFCERLAATRHDLRLVQLLASAERDFPYTGMPRLRDPESGRQRSIDARTGREAFLRRFGDAQSALAARCARAGIVRAVHHLDEDVLPALARVCAPR